MCVFSSFLIGKGVSLCVCLCVHVPEQEIRLYILYYGILGVMGPSILCCILYIPSPQKKKKKNPECQFTFLTGGM